MSVPTPQLRSPHPSFPTTVSPSQTCTATPRQFLSGPRPPAPPLSPKLSTCLYAQCPLARTLLEGGCRVGPSLGLAHGRCLVSVRFSPVCVLSRQLHGDFLQARTRRPRGGAQKTMEFIYKKLCTYSHMFKLQSPSKCSPLDAVPLSRRFFHCSKQCLISSIFLPFSFTAVFCLISSTWAKRFPWRTFSIPGNKKGRSG